MKAIKSDSEFQKEILLKSPFSSTSESNLTSRQAVKVVDFYADWCGPCKLLAPMLENLSKKYPKVNFYKVNTDDLQETAGSCGIRAMPTVQIYKNGRKVAEVVGANIGKIESEIKKVSGGSGTGSNTGYVLGSGKKVGAGAGGMFGTDDASRQQLFILLGLLAFLAYYYYSNN